MTESTVDIVSRLARQPSHKVGPLARRLSKDPTARAAYLDVLEAEMRAWRPALRQVVGGSDEGREVERHLRPYTTVLDTLLAEKVIEALLEQSPVDFVKTAPEPSKFDLDRQWVLRKRQDVADLAFERQLSEHFRAVVEDTVRVLEHDREWRRLTTVEQQLLTIRSEMITADSCWRRTPVYSSVTGHLNAGMHTAAMHMVADLDLIARMPHSQGLDAVALRDKAARSASIPRKFASLHLSQLSHAATAAGLEATAEPRHRRNGFVLDPAHFRERSGGVGFQHRLDDLEYESGAGRVAVADVPRMGPNLQCPAVHARVAGDDDGKAVIGLDSVWLFAVDAYAEAGLFDHAVRAANNERFAWVKGMENPHNAYVPYSLPKGPAAPTPMRSLEL